MSHQADVLFRALNGVFCAYKPVGMPMSSLIRNLKRNLCADLNSLVSERIPMIQKPILDEHPETGELYCVDRTLQPDYSQHAAVVGKRYQPEDIHIESSHEHTDNASGVCVLGVNDGCDALPALRNRRFLSVYEIGGLLGLATEDFTISSRRTRALPWSHVHPVHINRVLQRVQANNRRLMYEYAGVSLQSQDAFELASKGLLRPGEHSPTLFYQFVFKGLKKGRFFVEAYVINETDKHLAHFVHELGITLKTVACCVKIRRIRHGPFTSHISLLPKHWSLPHILHNIAHCVPLCTPDRLVNVPRWLNDDRGGGASISADQYVESIDVSNDQNDELIDDPELRIINEQQKRDQRMYGDTDLDSLWPARDRPHLMWADTRKLQQDQ